MTPPADNSWERLAAAARRRDETRPVAPPAEALPPPGFAARLAGKWAELRANETFRLWCRWSLIAAVAGLLFAAIVALVPDPLPPDSHPLSVPGVAPPALPSR